MIYNEHFTSALPMAFNAQIPASTRNYRSGKLRDQISRWFMQADETNPFNGVYDARRFTEIDAGRLV